MPDAVETIGGPPAVDQSGNLTIWWVPSIANPDAPTAAEIGATGAKRITYSFLPDGWNTTAPQEKNADERLTSKQIKQALGKISPDIADLRYVDSTAADSATVLLAAGGAGHLVERRNVPNSTLIATGQKVRVYKVSLGAQAPTPVDGTGKFYMTQPVVVEYMSAVVSVV